ncbi:MAG: hybrid sensor histidine kinase/response regulator [Anaerolineae bacterium]|nr:hybrid sensor histidine kinase/response regulator [Anaerolineae bacterium]
MTDSSDADLLNIFWVEVGDYLQTLNNALLHIEAATGTGDPELLREVNRIAHSMKGAAHAVGINVIETIAYYMEEIFESALNGRVELTPTVCDLIYDGIDLIQNVVNGVENPTETLATVLARLEQTVAGTQTSKPPPSEKKKKHTTATRTVQMTQEVGESNTMQLRPVEDSVRVAVSRLDRLMGELSELLVARMHSEERQRDFQQLHRLNHKWQREWRAVRTAYIRLARRVQNDPEGVPDDIQSLFNFLEANERHLIDTNRELARIVREMAQYNSQMAMLTEQMQDDIGGMRLVPFDSVVSGFQRLVRDMARDTDKNVYLNMVGAGVEMDKAALDSLKEPIMHLLRNAVDHGIETRSERERLGKAAAGRVEVLVEQRGKEILVKVSDDGRGLDAFRLGRAAVHAGLMTSQEASNLVAEDAYSLIFHPGLTTRDEVTSLSGRGMGMDIVRTRVESLRGRVTVTSTPHKGTTVTLRIPLLLTRLSCILLRVSGQDFAVPSVNVWRMLALRREDLFTAEGRDMVMVNERPLPVIPIDSVLGLPALPDKGDFITLLVLAVGDRAIAFQVDALYSEQELVLKQLGSEIVEAPYISGAALLGTGDVVIVLNANDLIRGAGGARPLIARPVQTEEAQVERKLRVLIVDDSITTRTLEKHILETAGFEVSVAVNGVEAWEKLSEITVDVVVADVEMPKMNGLELTRRIREHVTLGRLPIILLTSLSKPEQREAGLKAGADAYLVKSRFDQDELLRLIQAVV